MKIETYICDLCREKVEGPDQLGKIILKNPTVYPERWKLEKISEHMLKDNTYDFSKPWEKEYEVCKSCIDKLRVLTGDMYSWSYREAKVAEWVEREYSLDSIQEYECSNCCRFIHIHEKEYQNINDIQYCPYCGSLMDVPKNTRSIRLHRKLRGENVCD